MAAETLVDNADNAAALAEGGAEEIEAGEGEAVVLEDWQKSDEDVEKEAEAEAAAKLLEGEGDEIDDDKPKPEKTLKAKKKLQRKLEVKDSENDELKAEIARLKESKVTPTGKPTGRPVRPKEEDFDTDEDYEAARETYSDDLYDWRQSDKTAKQTETKAQEQKLAEIKEGVEAHFERAEALLETSGISPEKYNAANKAFREEIDSIHPGQGDFLADLFTSRMGQGSEKVLYNIGVNDTAKAEFSKLLRKDPSGIEAAIYLGQKKEQLTNPKKRKTNAPPPALNVKGDATGGKAGGSMKRAYDKAEKTGSAQAMYNAKKEAKKAGVDVSKW